MIKRNLPLTTHGSMAVGVGARAESGMGQSGRGATLAGGLQGAAGAVGSWVEEAPDVDMIEADVGELRSGSQDLGPRLAVPVLGVRRKQPRCAGS